MKRIGLGVLFLLLYCSPVSAQAPYFQGKTIRIVVGYPAGSAHDLWARLIAPQLTKQIPGNPATIVQQMPGAGSIVAVSWNSKRRWRRFGAEIGRPPRRALPVSPRASPTTVRAVTTTL